MLLYYLYHPLRLADVIQHVYFVIQILFIKLASSTLCCINKATMKKKQVKNEKWKKNHIENQTFLNLVGLMKNAHLLFA